MKGFTFLNGIKVSDEMRVDFRKILSSFVQVGACLIGMVAIIVTNSISYAHDDEISEYEIQETITPKEDKVEKNWIEYEGKIYYLDEYRNRLTGIQYLDGNFRYFLEDGSLYTGWIELEGKTFYFDPNNLGALVTGETYIDGLKYNFLPTGDLITGWYTTENGTFYKNSFGYDEFGFINEDNKLYYVSEDGLLIGTFTLDHIYYTDDNGAIYRGKCYIDGKESYFSDDGEYLYGWIKDERGYRYIDADKNEYIGKKNIDGKDYWFDDDGYLIVNQVVGMYQADSNGNLARMAITVDNLNAALDEILEKTGKDIKTIGEYVRTNHKYKYIDKLSSREEMAVYALNNRYISCYYYEALTGLLLERAGYEVITVKGVGFVYAEHYWSLVKTTRNNVEGWYHVDSLKAKYIRTDAEMVADGFKWTHSDYPATP